MNRIKKYKTMKHSIWINSIKLLSLIIPLLYIQCDLSVDENGPGNLQNGNNGGQNDDLCQIIVKDYPNQALSEEEISAILFMREEEKMAHDVYTKLHDLYQVNIFENISGAEERHMDALLCLINKYDLEDPVKTNDMGVFQNSDLQELYNTLVNKGAAKISEAYMVGAMVEELDIYNLMNLSQKTDNEDINAVFDDLTRGSRNHLRAFNKKLTNSGIMYKPQYITQTLFDEIISTEHEHGGLFCQNETKGKGPSLVAKCQNKGGKNGNCEQKGNGTMSRSGCQSQNGCKNNDKCART